MVHGFFLFLAHLGNPNNPQNFRNGYPKWWALEKVTPASNMAIFGIYPLWNEHLAPGNEWLEDYGRLINYTFPFEMIPF